MSVSDRTAHFNGKEMIEMIASAVALLRMTPRDIGLIEVLNEVRYLTTAQVQRVCYPSASIQTTSHRLTILRRRGVLGCLTHRTFDDRRAFWCLAPLGRAAAGSLAGTPPDGPRACALAAVQMDHLIATNQIFCDLCAQCRAGRLGPFRWFGSHHACVDLGETRVVPDAVILAVTPGGDVWSYALELDRGTMAPVALAAKFRRYRILRQIASLRRHEPLWEVRATSWVLFACPDPRRAALGAQVAAECGLERFWAGTALELPVSLAQSIGSDLAPPVDALPGLPGGVVPPAAPVTLQGGGRR
jgi:hypothetical protein